jgi:hypothetical protein
MTLVNKLQLAQIVVPHIPPKKNGTVGDLSIKAKQPLWGYLSFIFHSNIAPTKYQYLPKE